MKEKIIRYGLIIFSVVTIISISLLAVSQQSLGYNQTGNPVGYEYIENGYVLHTWNTFDDYYFNSTYLWQMSNIYPEYYTKNVLCGWYANPERHEFCVDTTLFTWSIETDNNTYVNITGYYDFSIGASQGKIIFTYYLGQNDTNLTIIPTIISTNKKGFDYDLGFTWYVRDIKINNTYENDIIYLSDGDGFDLSDNLSETFYDKSSYEIYDYGNDYKKFVGTYWNSSLDHTLSMISEDGEFNTPITLDINMGHLLAWETKSTTLYWKDPLEPITNSSGAFGMTDDVEIGMTWNHDFDCGTGMELIVGIAQDQDEGKGVTSLTYNGTAMSAIATHTSVDGEEQAELWNLSDPDCGESLAIVVTFNGTNSEEASGGSVVFYNVDYINLSTITKSECDGCGDSTISVPAKTTDTVVNVIAVDNDPLLSVGGENQLIHVQYDGGVDAIGMSSGYDSDADGEVTITWDWANDEYAQIGVALVPLPPPPDWTVSLGVNASQGTVKETLNYTGTGDSNTANYYMTVCRNDSITDAYPGTCDTGATLCTSAETADGVQTDCNYTTIASDEGLFTAYGFLCDSTSQCNTSTSNITVLLPIYGTINQTYLNPVEGINVTQNTTFEDSATACCVSSDADAKCGEVSGTALYNGSSGVDTLININTDTPFYIIFNSSLYYSIVETEGDGEADGGTSDRIGDSSGDVAHTTITLFNSSLDFEATAILISLGTCNGDDYMVSGDFELSICKADTPCGTLSDCTLVNNTWNVDFINDASKVVTLGFISPYTILSDISYAVLLNTTRSDLDAVGDRCRIRADSSPTTNLASYNLGSCIAESKIYDINITTTNHFSYNFNPINSTLNANECNTYNFTINATGAIGSNHRVGVNFTSSYGEVNISSNQTEDRLVNIITPYGKLNVSIALPVNGTNVTANSTFNLNVSVTCTGLTGQTCGTVSGLARYNTSGIADTKINATSGEVPFWLVGGGGVENIDIGNYWSQPDSDGNYSDICTDSDSDGICDTPMNISTFSSATGYGENVDSSPIKDLSLVTHADTIVDFSTSGVGGTEITDCTVISSGGDYYLSANITQTSADTCINITANNVVFDCQGNQIDSDETGNVAIQIARGTQQTTNVIVQNCNLTDWVGYASIWLYNADGNTIRDVSIINSATSFEFDYSDSNTIYKFISIDGSYGFYMLEAESNNIYDGAIYNGIYGFFLDTNTNTNNISNLDIKDQSSYGIYTGDVDGNIFYNSSIKGVTLSSIRLVVSSSITPNKFYRNLFNSTNNVQFVTANRNEWNSTTNISSGSTSNPTSCNNLDVGEQCNLTWTVNATGANETHWLIDVNFTSDLTGVEDNDTEDRKVCIGTCPSEAAVTPTMSVVLNQPETASEFNPSLSGVSFNITATVTNAFIKNCTVFTNFTGDWLANGSNTTAITSGVKSTVTTLSWDTAGSFIWNTLCYANDTAYSDFGDTNFTFTIVADTCSCPFSAPVTDDCIITEACTTADILTLECPNYFEIQADIYLNKRTKNNNCQVRYNGGKFVYS